MGEDRRTRERAMYRWNDRDKARETERGEREEGEGRGSERKRETKRESREGGGERQRIGSDI